MSVVIEVRGLRKSYRGVEAVKGIDFAVPEGSVFALLGPNGAGKTTTVEILEGYRRRDGGEVRVLGFDPAAGQRRFREQIGIVLQSTGVEQYLTAAEAVELYSLPYPKRRPAQEVLDIVGLSAQRNERVGRLSGGQRRRLDVAVALAGDPRVLFLDEPTTGFDPSARRGAWEVVENLAALGKTVFLTTHYMDEAQHLAHRVAVLAAGRIVAEGSPESLRKQEHGKTLVRFRAEPGFELPPGIGAVSQADGFIEIAVDDPTQALYRLTGAALDAGVELQALSVGRPSLEDVYLDITRTAEGGDE
ncbi:MAG TPA: ABC transporter ATP-binding protein [Actinomycetota bacterium]|jgi:ABC-2 type transport system ATP-binding protein|nr:ABC transporter ATP-binding protein [Actinomycetota bacterium]